jgi:nitroreductase
MDVFEAVEKRHSYRGEYKDQAVPREDLCRIVEAGLRAPSGYNLQTTSFVIVDEPDLVVRIADIVERPTVRGAKAIIVCVSEAVASSSGLAFEVEDASAAVENILLAVTAMGYATCWIDGSLRREGRAERIAELIGVPGGRTVRVILPIGVPSVACPQKEKKPFCERAFLNRWGGPQ